MFLGWTELVRPFYHRHVGQIVCTPVFVAAIAGVFSNVVYHVVRARFDVIRSGSILAKPGLRSIVLNSQEIDLVNEINNSVVPHLLA